MDLLLYKIGNLLYKYLYFIYRPLYFSYKRISDCDKIKLLKKQIKPGMTILDIGANIGFYSILFSKLAKENGKVYAFEPDLENFKKLKKNVKHLKNVIPLQLAVGDATKTIKLYKSKSLNVDHQTYDNGENRKSFAIQCVAIDDYLKNNEKIDFIKIDIQGYDYFAFKGMLKILIRSKGVGVLGEFWPYGLNKAGVNPDEYLLLLKDSGFSLNFFGEDKYKEKIYNNINNKLFYFDFYGTKP